MVGNFDFNENPVVHLDLDFDLGFVKLNFCALSKIRFKCYSNRVKVDEYILNIRLKNVVKK